MTDLNKIGLDSDQRATVDAAMEEYASKLHLLQQEYDQLREKCEQLEIDLEKKTQHSQEWCDKAMEAAGQRLAIQQEYDKLHSDHHEIEQQANHLREAYDNVGREYQQLKVEYDKLKGEKSFQVDINLGLHKEIIELKKGYAALKDKADVLMSAVNKAYGTLMGGRRRDTADTLNILNKAACAYYSNTKNKQGFINLVHAIAEDVSKDRESAEAYLKSEGVDVAKINAEGEWLAWKTKLMSMVSKHTGEWPVIKDAEARKYYDDGFTPEQYFREAWQNDVD